MRLWVCDESSAAAKDLQIITQFDPYDPLGKLVELSKENPGTGADIIRKDDPRKVKNGGVDIAIAWHSSRDNSAVSWWTRVVFM